MFENNFVCRLCLADSKANNASIFHTVSESVSLSEKVMVLANVQISEGDGLSKKICNSCISQVESFFAFKQQVENSDLVLRQRLTHQSFVQVNCNNNKNINVIYIKEEIDEDLLKEECVQSWSSDVDDYQNYNLKDEVEDDMYNELNEIETDIKPNKILNRTDETDSNSPLTFYSGIAYFHHSNKKITQTKFKLRKNKKLTLENKIQVIEQSKQGKSQRALAALFSCSKTQIQHILANKEHFNSEWQENSDKNCQFAKQKRENLVNERFEDGFNK